MGEIARGADGRRLFTPEFKKQQIDRVLRGEITLAELTRELDVSSSVTRRWKRLFEQGSSAAVSANEEVVSARLLRRRKLGSASWSARWGGRPWSHKILQAAQEEVKKRPSWYGVSRR